MLPGEKRHRLFPALIGKGCAHESLSLMGSPDAMGPILYIRLKNALKVSDSPSRAMKTSESGELGVSGPSGTSLTQYRMIFAQIQDHPHFLNPVARVMFKIVLCSSTCSKDHGLPAQVCVIWLSETRKRQSIEDRNPENLRTGEEDGIW